MEFEHTESITTTAPPGAVWALWKDVGSWHCWDPAVETVALEGHFGEGAAGTIVLDGGVTAPFVISVVEPGRRFLDRLTMGDMLVEVDHVVRPAGDGAEVTVSTTVKGPGAEAVGPMVVRDGPTALATLARMAEGG